MRLFVGIEIPDDTAARLVRAGPRAGAGVRRVRARDLHLTLHFIGEADVDAVRAALRDVRADRFTLEIAALGQFRMRGGRRIFWARADVVPGLLDLHRKTGAALAETGFVPEARAYLPHVTLARISREADAAQTDALIGAAEEKRFGSFEVSEFVLFDTAPSSSPFRYRQIERYPLMPHASPGS